MKKTIIQKGKNNILIEGDFHGSITIEKEEILPSELTMIPFIDPTEIVGRAAMLNSIKEKVESSRKPLVLFGVGGIGKSALAKLFIDTYKKDYQHIVWISAYGSIKTSFYDCIELKKNLKINEINIDEATSQIFNLLRQIKGKSLLVLDSVDETLLDYLDVLPKSPEWHILATSRVAINDLNCLKVQEIDSDSAFDLFQTYCAKPFATEEINALLQVIQYHPLSILLFAKAIAINASIQSLQPVIEVVKRNRLDDMQLKARIRLPYDRNESELLNHLLSIFDFSALDEVEIKTLSTFSYFPNTSINLELICYFFSLPPQIEQDRIQFINLLERLKTKGWLESDNQGTYRIHRLLQVVFLIHFNPSNDAILTFLHQLYMGVRNTNMVNTGDQLVYLPFVESALNNHPDSIKHDIFAAIATDSDRLFEYIGRVDDSIRNLNFAIEIWHRFPNPETNLELAKSYHNLGVTYFTFKSDIEKAFELQKKALEIREAYVEKHKTLHHSLAESYRQIATYYRSLHYYQEAATFAQKAIEVDTQTLPPRNPQHASNLKTLAELQSDIGNWEACIHYCHLSLEQLKKSILMNYEDVCDTLMLAAQAYAKLGQDKEADDILQQAIQKYTEIVPENSLIWHSIYSQAGDICRTTGNVELAFKYFEKAMFYTKLHFGVESTQYADLANNIGLLMMQHSDPKEALNLLYFALEIRSKVLGPEHFLIGQSAMNISETLFRTGDFKTAFEYGLYAHKILMNHDNTHVHLAFLHRNMAYIQIGLKQPMQARFHIEDCLEYAAAAFPNEDSHWAKDFKQSKESIWKLCEELEKQGFQ